MEAHHQIFNFHLKRGIKALSGCAAALLVVTVAPSAKADLLTYYNFNEQTSGAPSTATLTSDSPGLQTTTIGGNFDFTTTANVTTFAGTTVNRVGTDTASGGIAFLAGAVNGGVYPNNGKYFQFTVSTVGYSALVLSYASQRSGTGFTSQALSYSTDGTNFTAISTNTTIAASFALTTFDLSSIAAVNGDSSLTLRITLDGATSASANNRFDNIQLNATAVPEPATVLGGALAFGVLGWSQRRRLSGLCQSDRA